MNNSKDTRNNQNEPDPSTPSNFAQDDTTQDVGRGTSDMEDKCQEYLDGWKRAKADYDNLKKDFEKSRVEIAEYANENLLYELLPAIEHFETALEHVPDISNLPDEDKKKLQNWITGVKAVKQLWEQAFRSIGLEHIETKNGFDPALHEAMSTEQDPEKEENEIIKIIQPGWKLRDKVIRPTKVIVNSKTPTNNIP